MSFLNPKTGIRIRPIEPGDPGYGPESEAFFKAFMESEPGDEFDTTLRANLDRLVKDLETIKAKRRAQAHGDGEPTGDANA